MVHNFFFFFGRGELGGQGGSGVGINERTRPYNDLAVRMRIIPEGDRSGFGELDGMDGRCTFPVFHYVWPGVV